jgi:hypothetical protein
VPPAGLPIFASGGGYRGCPPSHRPIERAATRRCVPTRGSRRKRVTARCDRIIVRSARGHNAFSWSSVDFGTTRGWQIVNVSPDELPVSISGRWGPRRVCVTECSTVVTAEDVYDCLLVSGSKFGPGAYGEILMTVDGTTRFAKFEVRPNAIWRQGRVFLRCDFCKRRCTRLYMPTLRNPLRCRRCWGLTYESSRAHNYRGHGLFSPRMASVMSTFHVRETRRHDASLRWKTRRRLRERLRSANSSQS